MYIPWKKYLSVALLRHYCNYCQLPLTIVKKVLILRLPVVVTTPLYMTPANFILNNLREQRKKQKTEKKNYILEILENKINNKMYQRFRGTQLKVIFR